MDGALRGHYCDCEYIYYIVEFIHLSPVLYCPPSFLPTSLPGPAALSPLRGFPATLPKSSYIYTCVYILTIHTFFLKDTTEISFLFTERFLGVTPVLCSPPDLELPALMVDHTPLSVIPGFAAPDQNLPWIKSDRFRNCSSLNYNLGIQYFRVRINSKMSASFKTTVGTISRWQFITSAVYVPASSCIKGNKKEMLIPGSVQSTLPHKDKPWSSHPNVWSIKWDTVKYWPSRSQSWGQPCYLPSETFWCRQIWSSSGLMYTQITWLINWSQPIA